MIMNGLTVSHAYAGNLGCEADQAGVSRYQSCVIIRIS